MLEELKVILDIQELDMKMLRLMKLKTNHAKELGKLKAVEENFQSQVKIKEEKATDIKTQIRVCEREIEEYKEQIKKLEGQQDLVKKVEEFNALAQEISTAERAKLNVEQKLREANENLETEEEELETLKQSLEEAKQNCVRYESEIKDALDEINQEGQGLKSEREELAKTANSELLSVYERLLQHKKDRVLVPIENRACSGCHILVTAQHENLVRKADRLVFCEHCSRVHYWQEAAPVQEEETKKRRRRTVKAAK